MPDLLQNCQIYGQIIVEGMAKAMAALTGSSFVMMWYNDPAGEPMLLNTSLMSDEENICHLSF